ncbi:amino acid adenylation domain protein [Aspergillus niger]|uniref:Amino acid adenylation domain protein n=2 Tax=Aspergillus niger TaxID=5061 RepID=A0A505INW4_ASPNG|nr:amino acid adenylation domain protein [Aspergillus niger]
MESSLPEQIFLDLPIAVVNKTARMRLVELAMGISAQYHIDGRATGGVYSDLRDNGDGPFELHESSVYDLVMEDAQDRELAEGNPELYSVTLRFYRDSSPNDGRRDIIEGILRTGTSCLATG